MLRDLAVEFCAVVLNPWEMSMLMEMIRAHIQLCFLACTPKRCNPITMLEVGNCGCAA